VYNNKDVDSGGIECGITLVFLIATDHPFAKWVASRVRKRLIDPKPSLFVDPVIGGALAWI